MSWDMALNPTTGDLIPGVVTGSAEILQRLRTRLNREYGEWFLDTTAGLPWYQEGNGLLGSKNRQLLILLVRRETLNTEGVERILQFNLVYTSATRYVSIFMQLLLTTGEIATQVFEFTEADKGDCDMQIHNLLQGRNAANAHPARSIVFDDGSTLQDVFNRGGLGGGGSTPANITVNTISPDGTGNITITRLVTQAEFNALSAANALVRGARYIVLD